MSRVFLPNFPTLTLSLWLWDWDWSALFCRNDDASSLPTLHSSLFNKLSIYLLMIWSAMIYHRERSVPHAGRNIIKTINSSCAFGISSDSWKGFCIFIFLSPLIFLACTHSADNNRSEAKDSTGAFSHLSFCLLTFCPLLTCFFKYDTSVLSQKLILNVED